MSKAIELHPVTWERMIRAVEKVRERLLRATSTLESAGIPFAVVDGNAVAAWSHGSTNRQCEILQMLIY